LERLPSCTPESFHRKAKTSVSAALKPALDPLFCTLEQLEKQIDAYDEQVKPLAKKYPDVEVIAQPKGVGALTALAFLLTLEDKTRFAKSRTVGPSSASTPSKLSQATATNSLASRRRAMPLCED